MISSTATRFPFILTDSFGTPVTGVLPADVKNAMAYVTKGDGSTTMIPLTSQNFFEIDSVNQPGIYQLLVTAPFLNILGKISIVLYPAVGSTFLTKVLFEDVGTSLSDITLIKKFLYNNEVVDQGNAILRLYDDNGIDILAEWYLQDESTGKSIFNIRRKIRKV